MNKTPLSKYTGPALITLIWAALLLVCGVPIVVAAIKFAGAAEWPVFDARSLRLLSNSLIVAGGSAVVACLLGAPVGFAIGRGRSNIERFFACAAAIPLLMPPYVTAITWIDLSGPRNIAALVPGNPAGPLFSPAGAAWILGSSYLTIPAAAVALAARSAAWSGIGPARHARGAFVVFARIVFPVTQPYLVAAGALVFLLSLAEFGVPSLLLVPVYPVEIHTLFATKYDVPGAISTSIPIIGVGLLALIATTAYLRRVPRPLSTGEMPTSDAGLPAVLRRSFFTAAAGVLAISVLSPVIALIRRIQTWTNFREAWDTAGTELGATVMVGIVCATLSVALGFSLLALPRRAALRGAGTTLSAVAFLMPGSAVAIALIAAWNHSGWRAALYDGPAVLVLACSARLVAVAVVVLTVSLVSRSREWDEAARVAGAPWWRRWILITLPASAPALAIAWAVTFVLSSREADASVLVAPPGFTTLPVRLLALMHYGPSAVVAALSLIVITVALAGATATLGVAWWFKRWAYGSA